MNKNLILIIGGGIESIPGIMHLQKNGHDVLVVDKSSKAPSKKISNYFIKSSIYNIQDILKKTIDFNKTRKINAVLSLSADVPLTVAKCANALGLYSIPIKAAKIFSDKLLMKKFFKKNGINTPFFKSIKSLQELKKNLKKKKGKDYIIKPLDNRGARGVLKFQANDNIEKLYKKTKKNTNKNKILLEEFLSGQQLSTESVVYNSKVVTVGISDRNYDKLKDYSPYVIENGSDLPSYYTKRYYKKINSLIKKIAKKSQIKNGSLKGDLVIHKNKIYVIEIAARLSGGYFSSKMIPAYNHYDLLKKVTDINLKKKKININQINKKISYVSQRFFFPKKGTISKIHVPKWIKNNKHLVHLELNIGNKMKIKNITNHSDRVGQIIVKSNSRINSIKIINKMIKSVVFKYK